MSKGNPLTDFERELAAVVWQATFVPGTGAKRFIREINEGRIQNLTEKGRWYLAYCANRFRRQYQLSAEQWAWVWDRLNGEILSKSERTIPEEIQPIHQEILPL